MEILARTQPILDKEPNLIRIEGKITVVGDVHGQFYDFHGMMKKLHKPE